MSVQKIYTTLHWDGKPKQDRPAFKVTAEEILEQSKK